jgi:small subunit ribosomal protein S4
MGRYCGPVCRLCRREGVKLFLKGQKCYTAKCPVEKRTYAPGQHGQGRVKLSDYGIQLREKQKAKRIYSMFERQFGRYFKIAQKSKGVTGQMLLQQLERRLDNVIYRLGFAASRAEGRQMVHHRGIQINGRLIDVPSYQVKVGDVVQVAPGAEGWAKRIKTTLETTKDRPVPAWIQVDGGQQKGTIIRLPERDDLGLPIQEQLIVELYSK